MIMMPDPFKDPKDPDAPDTAELETHKLIFENFMGDIRRWVAEHIDDLEAKGLSRTEAVTFGHELHAVFISKL